MSGLLGKIGSEVVNNVFGQLLEFLVMIFCVLNECLDGPSPYNCLWMSKK